MLSPSIPPASSVLCFASCALVSGFFFFLFFCLLAGTSSAPPPPPGSPVEGCSCFELSPLLSLFKSLSFGVSNVFEPRVLDLLLNLLENWSESSCSWVCLS